MQRTLLLTLFACGWMLALTSTASGQMCLRPGDELWEISSRCLPQLSRCETLSPVNFKFTHRTSSGWEASNEAEFLAHIAAAPEMVTVIYVHGNWMTADNARGRGIYVYQRLAARADRPIRVILYTWPSQRDGRPIADVYEKYTRSDIDTYYFASLLGRIPAETRVGLIGFSFGGRVVCGAMHLINGGTVEGRRIETGGYMRTTRVSMIAPAFDRSWLAEGKPYGKALLSVESLVNIYNSSDPVLRRYRFLDRVSEPIAAGFSGITDRATVPLQADSRIRQYDCSSSVGSSHDELTYYRECCAYNWALDNVLWK